MSKGDLKIVDSLPQIKIWGEDFDKIGNLRFYKGKFVVIDDGKFFAKLFPLSKWDSIEFFHDMLIRELGVNDARSMDIKNVVMGGGKVEVELMDDYIECRLYGKSGIYGNFDSNSIDMNLLENEIRNVFNIDEIPVNIVPNYEY